MLEERKLTFLLPLLHIRAEIWRQLETEPTPEAFMAWLLDTVALPHQTDPAFILALVHNLLRYVTERAAGGEGADAAEKEKELIVNLKPVLQALRTRPASSSRQSMPCRSGSRCRASILLSYSSSGIEESVLGAKHIELFMPCESTFGPALWFFTFEQSFCLFPLPYLKLYKVVKLDPDPH